VVGDVNIHEICERVRSLILAEYPRGLEVERDYDASIPEFRGDREQLIQAVLNIAQNATGRWRRQALSERIARGDARIVLRTRVARQVTIGKQRFDWHWNCISRTTGRACPRPSAIASSTPGVGARRRLGPRADAGADLRAATPGHDRMRQRAGPDGVQAAHPLAVMG
jgi:hypothetical protein